MKSNFITLTIEGEIVLQDFANTLNNFNLLLNELSKEAGDGSTIDWVIDDLHTGSAVATFIGINPDEKITHNVIYAFENVWDSVITGNPFPYSERIKKIALDLTKIVNNKVTGIKVATQNNEHVINGQMADVAIDTMRYSYGSVKGMIETLSKRKGLHFTLWDSLFDRPIKCYFNQEQEDEMRKVWGKKVLVTGKIGRKSGSNIPELIKEIREIEIIDEISPGNYHKARGILKLGSEKPEDMIRRLRDG
jgi:hypothetical protein